ncbi:MAG TPA: hypothetical protein VN957_30260 [Chthoniobacterales bacterium]|nr:hypothetical protein [Chthoniobacterales bacterium]
MDSNYDKVIRRQKANTGRFNEESMTGRTGNSAKVDFPYRS